MMNLHWLLLGVGLSLCLGINAQSQSDQIEDGESSIDSDMDQELVRKVCDQMPDVCMRALSQFVFGEEEEGASEQAEQITDDTQLTNDMSGEQEKRKSALVRLGKRKSALVRLGKRKSAFVRLGKRKSALVRLGKRKSAFVRLG